MSWRFSSQLTLDPYIYSRFACTLSRLYLIPRCCEIMNFSRPRALSTLCRPLPPDLFPFRGKLYIPLREYRWLYFSGFTRDIENSRAREMTIRISERDSWSAFVQISWSWIRSRHFSMFILILNPYSHKFLCFICSRYLLGSIFYYQLFCHECSQSIAWSDNSIRITVRIRIKWKSFLLSASWIRVIEFRHLRAHNGWM